MGGLTDSGKTEVSMHELGHAMGLDHTSGCISVMESSGQICGYNYPSADDVAGIDYRY